MSQNNALVEIALALAMAFFSIMILAMVSMGVSDENLKTQSSFYEKRDNAIDVRHSSSEKESESQRAGAVQISRDEMIIFFDGKFFNADLAEILERDINLQAVKFLAVDPSISALDAVNVRKRFSSNSLVVTLLNDNWLAILKENHK